MPENYAYQSKHEQTALMNVTQADTDAVILVIKYTGKSKTKLMPFVSCIYMSITKKMQLSFFHWQLV